MLKKVRVETIEQPRRGLNTFKDIFSLQAGESPDSINVEFKFTSIEKRLGVDSMNTTQLGTGGYGMLDFGIGVEPQTRRLLAAYGTGIFYSTDVGKTWTVCQSSKNAAITNFDFVKQWAFFGDDNYGTPQFWTGSANTHFTDISTAAPAAKYPLNHQGFLFYFNETNNQRGVYYVDENTITSEAFSNFSLPSERNDEITGGFVLRKILYVSTKYKIFKLTFVGGSPDWSFSEVKNWGFVPRTFKKVQLPNIGEVVMGLDWTKRIRIFDGSADETISDHIQDNNTMTSFYLKNIPNDQLEKSWSENDTKEQVYRLYVAQGTATEVSHEIVYNYRNSAFYSSNNRLFQSGVLAQDTGSGIHMLVIDSSGTIYHIDSGNIDVNTGTSIDEHYSSFFFTGQPPSTAQKIYKVNLFFSVTSSGALYYEDRIDYGNVWNTRETFDMVSAISAVQTSQSIDVALAVNAYQFQISSSANAAAPWRLNRVDLIKKDIGIGAP